MVQLQPKGNIDLSFVPWRGDFTRGIFVSSIIHCELSLEELIKLYEDFYKGHPFTHVSKDPVFLKQVVNTNKAVIQLEKAGSKLVVHSAIDNLLKGASGQAVQNMNLLFGFDETTGLQLKPTGILRMKKDPLYKLSKEKGIYRFTLQSIRLAYQYREI